MTELNDLGQLEQSANAKDLVNRLERIRQIHERKISESMSVQNYEEAAEEYDAMSAAYDKAIDLITKSDNDLAELRLIVSSLSEIREYWRKNSIELRSKISRSVLDKKYQETKELIAKGMHQEAIDKLKDILDSEYPEKDKIFNDIANAYFDLADYDNAIKYYEMALKLKRDNPDYWYNKGNALYYNSNFEEAINCYSKAIEINPHDAEAWTFLGHSYALLSKLDKALESYEKALEIDPHNDDFLINKGGVLYEMRSYKEALECYNMALLIKPNNPDALVSKANTVYNIETDEGKAPSKDVKLYDKITSYYDQALDIDRANFDAWFGKAFVLTDLARYNEVIEYYERALEINPDSIQAKENLAEALMLAGKFQNSREMATELYKTTSDPLKGFIMRLIITFSFFLEKKPKEGRGEARSLLEYSKSLLFYGRPEWYFDNMKDVLGKSSVSTGDKVLLSSFISFMEKDSEQERHQILERIAENLENTDFLARIVRRGGEHLSEKDIEPKYNINFTSKPDEKQKGWRIWNVFIKATGDDLSKMRSVKYILPPYFNNPERTVDKDRANRNFQLEIKAYGEFRIRADITLDNDTSVTKYEWLRPYKTTRSYFR